jgi:hypothetical protein
MALEPNRKYLAKQNQFCLWRTYWASLSAELFLSSTNNMWTNIDTLDAMWAKWVIIWFGLVSQRIPC